MSSLTQSIFTQMLQQQQSQMEKQQQDRAQNQAETQSLLQNIRQYQMDQEASKDKAWQRHMEVAKLEGEQSALLGKAMPQGYGMPSKDENAQIGYNAGLIENQSSEAAQQNKIALEQVRQSWHPADLISKATLAQARLDQGAENNNARLVNQKGIADERNNTALEIAKMRKNNPYLWQALQVRMRGQDLMAGNRDDSKTRQLEQDIGKSGVLDQMKVFDDIHGVLQRADGGDAPGIGTGRSLAEKLPFGSAIANAIGGEDATILSTAKHALMNMQLKDRSGAAVTDQEFERYRQELGGWGANEDTQLLAIERMYQIMLKHLQNVGAGYSDKVVGQYQEQGGDPALFKARPKQQQQQQQQKPQQTAAPSDDPREAKVQSFMQKNGIKDRAQAVQAIHDAGYMKDYN